MWVCEANGSDNAGLFGVSVLIGMSDPFLGDLEEVRLGHPMSSLGIQNRHGSSEEDSKGRVKGVRRCNVVHPPCVWFGILAAAGFLGHWESCQ